MKTFLQKILTLLLNKTLWAAAIIALSLWIYTSLSQDNVIDVYVPLSVVLPEDQALENEIPTRVNVVFSGKGWDLFYFKYFNKDILCEIDMTDDILKDSIAEISNQRIMSSLRLQSDVTAIAVKNDPIIVLTGKIIEKRVPIVPNIAINTKSGYKVLGDIKIKPRNILLRGNQNLLRNIEEWKTEKITYNDVSSNIDAVVLVKNDQPDMIMPLQSEVTISVSIHKTADITIKDIPIKIRGRLSPGHKIYPNHLNVSVSGTIKDIAEITRDSIRVYFNATQIINDKAGVLVPHIILPRRYELLSTTPLYIEHIKEHR